MSKQTDINILHSELEFLPVETRVPLKFGNETLTSVTCARVQVRVRNAMGAEAIGWGETPLSVQWVWPSRLATPTDTSGLRHFANSLSASTVTSIARSRF